MRAAHTQAPCEVSITIRCTHAYESSGVREKNGTKVDARMAGTIEMVLKRVVAGYPLNVATFSIQPSETCGVLCLCTGGPPPRVQDALTTGLRASIKGLTHIGEEDIDVQYSDSIVRLHSARTSKPGYFGSLMTGVCFCGSGIAEVQERGAFWPLGFSPQRAPIRARSR